LTQTILANEIVEILENREVMTDKKVKHNKLDIKVLAKTVLINSKLRQKY